jgi:hypothetical protein
MVAFGLCLTIGLLLAQWFRVFVLVPCTLLVVGVGLTSGIVGAETLLAKMLVAVIDATGLQAGYLLGMALTVYLLPPAPFLPST